MAKERKEMNERQEEIIAELGFERHHPTKTKKTQPQIVTHAQGRDCFQTPNYAVDLLTPFIPRDKVHSVWEPAAGEKKIVKRILETTDFDVFASDIRKDLDGVKYYNFLTGDCETLPWTDWGWKDMNGIAIITNPPFSLKRKFYNTCRTFNAPFALLIPADYSGWIINACWHDGAEKIIPTRRIDYITPSGKSGATGNLADFHSMWLTWGFGLGRTETFVDLSVEERKNNI